MCQIVEDPESAADTAASDDKDPSIAIEIVVSDTGCGMAPEGMGLPRLYSCDDENHFSHGGTWAVLLVREL